MKITKEHKLIIFLCAVCLFLGYMAYNKEKQPFDKELSEKLIDSLKNDSKRLNLINDSITKEKNKDSAAIDSLIRINDSLTLVKQKVKIKIEYYEKFKTNSVKSSVDSMRAIFSENGIK